MNNDELINLIEELVWSAWSAGNRAGGPNASRRAADREHAEVWHELERLKERILNPEPAPALKRGHPPRRISRR